MKLLVVSPYFYPKIGGMENYAYQISRRLKEQYHWDIVVITSNHVEKKYKEEAVHGLKIYRLPSLFKLSNSPIHPLWYFSIKKIIEKEKPTIINAHSPVPYIADIARLASGNIPYILTYHAGSMKKNKLIIDILIRVYESLFLHALLQNSHTIICYTNEFIMSNMQQFMKKVAKISPGVDITLFKPTAQYRHNKVLFVGRLEKSSEWKGVYYLLDAMKKVIKHNNSCILEVVGDGDALESYKAYSKKLHIDRNVYFLGSLTGKKIAAAYQNASVLVLPSTSNAESFGMVLIEAMASGIPVIGSNIGGIPHVIDNEKNGLLVAPKNASDLADALLKLLKDTEYSKKLGRNGAQKAINTYGWDKKVKEYNKLLYAAAK